MVFNLVDPDPDHPPLNHSHPSRMSGYWGEEGQEGKGLFIKCGGLVCDTRNARRSQRGVVCPGSASNALPNRGRTNIESVAMDMGAKEVSELGSEYTLCTRRSVRLIGECRHNVMSRTIGQRRLRRRTLNNIPGNIFVFLLLLCVVSKAVRKIRLTSTRTCWECRDLIRHQLSKPTPKPNKNV
jgi:hypothetical protein